MEFYLVKSQFQINPCANFGHPQTYAQIAFFFFFAVKNTDVVRP